ncbi:hypothetical protein DFJ74DRAFT_678732 [Hyaloraphidium curvatum]|nr:hypothetical protein DFJ74DRAFT_678732 [Hyaloraphidium curvatum]
MYEIKGRTALVTGGASGIGESITERLALRGANVISANRTEADGKAMVETMSARFPGQHFAFVKCDMVDHDSVRAAFKEAVEKSTTGTVDILINNAGWTIDPVTFQLEVDEETDRWLPSLEGHLVGTILMTRLAMSHWKKKAIEGVCIMTASIVGMLPDNESGPTFHPDISYSLSKVGMIMATKQLQKQVDYAPAGSWPKRPRFGCIQPGMTWAAIWTKSGYATPKDVEESPLWRNIFPAVGGWTPMPELMDAYERLITDERLAGHSYVVSGEKGRAVLYDPLYMRLADERKGAPDDPSKVLMPPPLEG